MHLRSDRETVVTLELSLYLLKHKFGSYCFPASNLKFQTVSTFFPLQKLQTLHLFLTICCQSPQDGRLVKNSGSLKVSHVGLIFDDGWNKRERRFAAKANIKSNQRKVSILWHGSYRRDHK